MSEERISEHKGVLKGYKVEARYNGAGALNLGNEILTKDWLEMHFSKTGYRELGVPARNETFMDASIYGLLPYQAAQALRWWVHAAADTEYKDRLLETRLIECKINFDIKVDRVAEIETITEKR